MADLWGVWSSWSKKWCFGIAEPTKRKASDALFNKIGKDAYKWRFEYRKYPNGVVPKNPPKGEKMGNIADYYIDQMQSGKMPAGRYNTEKGRHVKMTTGQQDNSTNVTTGEVRLIFVNLFTPRANQPGQEAKYSTTILIPKSDTATMARIQTAIQAAIQKGVTGVWGGARPAQPRTPIHDGDGVRPNGEAFGPECKGHWVLTASSKQQQSVVDLNLNPIINQSEVYSGMYGRVNINFFAYSNSGNKGIGAGLGPVQKTRDGEALGGRVSVEQAFGDALAGVGYQQPSHQPPTGWEQAAPQPQYGQQPAAPQYGQQPPVQQGYGYGQPAYQQQPVQPMQQAPQQIDPITGKPVNGGVWGI